MPGKVQGNAQAALFQIINNLGYDPEAIMLNTGSLSGTLQNSDHEISTSKFVTLLQHCAQATGCSYIGLLLGAEVKLSWLGRAGFIAQNSADLREALACITTHINLRHRSASILLNQEQPLASLTYYPLVHDESQEQWLICAVSAGVKLIRELCSSNWAPAKINLAVKKPTDIALYSGYFQTEMRFGAADTALKFIPSLLDQPITNAQPDIRALLQRDIDYSDGLYEFDLLLDVTRIVRALIGTGQCSAEKICEILKIRSRSLNSRLVTRGKTLQQVVEEVRFEIARQLMRNTPMTLAEISARLDYSEVSAFNRAFNRWAGMPPGDWRRRNTGA